MIYPSMVILGMIDFFFLVYHITPHYPPIFKRSQYSCLFVSTAWIHSHQGPRAVSRFRRCSSPGWYELRMVANCFGQETAVPPSVLVSICFYDLTKGNLVTLYNIINYASVIKTRDKHSMMNMIHHYPLWIHCSNSLSWNKADLIYIYIIIYIYIFIVTPTNHHASDEAVISLQFI